MENIKEIRPVAFHFGGRKVSNKQDANFVKLLIKDGFLTLRKDLIKEETWARLPETVS